MAAQTGAARYKAASPNLRLGSSSFLMIRTASKWLGCFRTQAETEGGSCPQRLARRSDQNSDCFTLVLLKGFV